jgi:hypothetical protein
LPLTSTSPQPAPEVFANLTVLENGIEGGNPWRNSDAGEAGPRNMFRGDGYFGIDSALTKGCKVRESQLLKFA